jgi:hypothetical protein
VHAQYVALPALVDKVGSIWIITMLAVGGSIRAGNACAACYAMPAIVVSACSKMTRASFT